MVQGEEQDPIVEEEDVKLQDPQGKEVIKDKTTRRLNMIKHTKQGLKADMKRRSKENWERGRGARKIGNPRYKPIRRRDKNDVLRKLYVLRKR